MRNEDRWKKYESDDGQENISQGAMVRLCGCVTACCHLSAKLLTFSYQLLVINSILFFKTPDMMVLYSYQATHAAHELLQEQQHASVMSE